MLKVIVGACKKVGVRIVQGWAESHNLHVSLPQQRHTLIRYEVVKLRAGARLEFVRTDLDQALHFVWPNKTKLTGPPPPTADNRQLKGPYRRVRSNAWLGRTYDEQLNTSEFHQVVCSNHGAIEVLLDAFGVSVIGIRVTAWDKVRQHHLFYTSRGG